MQRTPKRVSVVHLIHTMAYGGVETSVINWLRMLDRERFDVHLVCFENPGNTEAPFVKEAARQGLQVSKIPWSRRKPLLKAARTLAGLVRRHRADILHTHNCYADCVGVLTARLTPVRTVTTVYVWARHDWKRNLIQAINKVVIRFFDHITVHCQDTYEKTLKLGIAPERMTKLICGYEGETAEMPWEERQERRRRMGFADDQPLLINVARLYPEKLHDSLLRCFRRVLDESPRARLLVVGVGPLLDKLVALRRELGLESAVELLGWVEDLPGLLRLADVQVHPAAIEGVPLAVCEGMAAGLPVIASAVGGIPEVLKHERTGLLVASGDEAGFVAAISRLVADPELARRLGKAARSFIANDYSLAGAVAHVEQTYDRVIGSCA